VPANNARFLWIAGVGSDRLASGGGAQELNAMLLASGHCLILCKPPSISSALSFYARSVDGWALRCCMLAMVWF
jgi:hypothetical protein